MAVNIQTIQFAHLLYDTYNKPIKTGKVQIQFYNVNLKSWLSLTDVLIVSNGKLAHSLAIPYRISTTDQTIRVVREMLKSGGTPSFRIINASSSSRLPEVIETNFKAVIKDDITLTIDFDKSWLLDPKKYIAKDDHIVIATQVPMFELTNTIQTIEIEKDKAIAQVSELNATITSLSDERQLLQNQLSNIQNDIETQHQQLADLNTSLQTVSSNLESERTLRETLEADKTNLETQLAAQREEMAAMEAISNDGSNFEVLYNELQIEVADIHNLNTDLQQQIDSITIERDDLQLQISTISLEKENLLAQVSEISTERDNLQQQVADISIQKENLEQQNESFLANISELQTAVQREKELTKATQLELQNTKILIETLEQNNTKLQQQLEEAQDFSITDHPNKLSASKVYSSIVNDVIKADAELANSNYKLSNISVNLKTTVEKGPEGTIFGLLDYESAKDVNSAAISDITLDIVPSQNTVTIEKDEMPNVLGLTETAVRKVLQTYGLRLDAVYHATKDENLVEGQSFKQSPAPGNPVEEGQEVLVIFAKPLN
ncbi:PASTA domain-containing protein [Kordia periserrulae]|uniref:PASTA domain-containing protein n=1 Tax=Kordia periserrulae TaxID=701523 RepID=A0A2T6BUN9_9FLAO|nr:PASTA domain-containing protein [Kordia periserrulae]PTX59785.1 PASTA domain-containing protein [Kordia periserrulae]